MPFRASAARSSEAPARNPRFSRRHPRGHQQERAVHQRAIEAGVCGSEGTGGGWGSRPTPSSPGPAGPSGHRRGSQEGYTRAAGALFLGRVLLVRAGGNRTSRSRRPSSPAAEPPALSGAALVERRRRGEDVAGRGVCDTVAKWCSGSLRSRSPDRLPVSASTPPGEPAGPMPGRHGERWLRQQVGHRDLTGRESEGNDGGRSRQACARLVPPSIGRRGVRPRVTVHLQDSLDQVHDPVVLDSRPRVEARLVRAIEVETRCCPPPRPRGPGCTFANRYSLTCRRPRCICRPSSFAPSTPLPRSHERRS